MSDYYFKSTNFGFGKPPKVDENLACDEGSGRIFYAKGTNGSGKSTIPTHICANDPDQKKLYIGKKRTASAVVCPSYRIAFVGRYDKNANCGGADTVSNFSEMEEIIGVLCKDLPDDYDIYFEGIIAATIFETWIERLKNFNKPLVVVYHCIPDALAVERVLGRNGGEESDKLAALIREKNKRIRSHIERYPTLYPEVGIFQFDMEKVKKEEMSEIFNIMRGVNNGNHS